MAIISKINSKCCNWHPTVYNYKVSRSVKWSRSKGSDNTSASCNPGHAAGDLKDPKGGCFVEGGSSRLLTEPNSARTGSLQTEKVVFDFRILPGRLNPSVYRTLSESTSFTPFLWGIIHEFKFRRYSLIVTRHTNNTTAPWLLLPRSPEHSRDRI